VDEWRVLLVSGRAEWMSTERQSARLTAAGVAVPKARLTSYHTVSILMLAAALLLAGCNAQVPPSVAATATQQPDFGTLVSSPEHSAEEVRAGVDVAMVELSWAQFEPAEDRFDENYIRRVRAAIDGFRASGRRVTLGLGLHSAPHWLQDQPDSRMIDEQGAESDALNLVFDQRLRNEAEDYLKHVAAGIDMASISAVRLTSGALAEVLYPEGGGYWAFDDNAQNGEHLPASMAPNPFPGWRPGDTGLSEAQVREWAGWYVGGLVDVVTWQITALSRLGFRGEYEVLCPGVGVRPDEYTEAVRHDLPRGLLGVGAAWQELFARLPKRQDLVAYSTSVADGSGDNDTCDSRDRTVPLDASEIATWSASRWMTRIAVEHGLRVSGENPGYFPPQSVDGSYADQSDDGLMATAIRQASACGFETFYWAHDEQLWNGTVSFSRYASLIAKTTG
jgi:hypothetical protein